MTELLDQADDLDDGMADDRPANIYPDVFAFVSDFLAQLYAREVHDQRHSFRWCSQWWNHTEAVARLEAVWKAWEVLRLDPGTGAGVWFRDFLDPCMAALTHSEGPFAQCTETRHKPPRPLPLIPPPAGLNIRGEASRKPD